MRGARPISEDEEERLLQAFTGPCALRNRCLLTLGCNTGYRISELLSLNLGDVLSPGGKLLDEVVVWRRHTKGRRQSRGVALNDPAKVALTAWLPVLHNWGGMLSSCPLFPTRGLQRLNRITAYLIMRGGCMRAGVGGRVATHSMRKTYAGRVYDYFLQRHADGDRTIDPFRAVSKSLGHASVTATDRYLQFDEQLVTDATLAIGRRQTHKQNGQTDGRKRT